MKQTKLAAALLDPDSPLPARFAIHRNTVFHSLMAALEAGFPVTRRLVGADFFAETARIFLRQHPPRSPVLMLYGVDFPSFLQGFAPAQSLPYLPDLAALEQALRESYHAADLPAITAEAFAKLTPVQSLRLSPALRLVRSDWPIWAIWTAKGEGPLPPVDGTDVVILRPGFDPLPHPLPCGGGVFLASLLEGQSLGQALSDTPTTFNLTAVLTLLLRGNGVVCGA